MKDFIEKLVSYIVSEGVNFEIKEEPGEGLTTYVILVPEAEIGKIIGKGGKVINALRTICRLKAGREQQRILLKVDKLQ